MAAPAVVIRHLAGEVSFGAMLEAQKHVGGPRACALELDEMPALLDVLHAESLDDVASTLRRLLDEVPARLLDRRSLFVPLMRGDPPAFKLAVVTADEDIHLAALLMREDGGVRVKYPGSPERDRLQARMSEFPITTN